MPLIVLWALACGTAPLEREGLAEVTGVPTMEQALLGVCGDSFPQVQPRGDDLHKITLKDENALCNDGSPAVLFVREASDPAYEKNWVIHFEGGASCEDGLTCAERWCGIGPHNAAKMSSRFTSEVGRSVGWQAPHEGNELAKFNQVLFYYCSSDMWTGSRKQVEVSGVLEGEEFSYTLNFLGNEIATAGLEALAAGVISDDGEVQLPALTEGEVVVVGGSSAGASAVAHQVNALAKSLPESRVIAVFDSLHFPDSQFLPKDEGELIESALQEHYEQVFVDLYGAVFDEDCVKDAEEPYYCIDHGRMQRQFVHTEKIVLQDVGDPVLFSNYAQVDLSLRDFRSAQYKSLAAMDQSVFVSDCRNHTVLQSLSGAYETFAQTSDQALNAVDAVSDLVSGEMISAVEPGDCP